MDTDGQHVLVKKDTEP